MPQTQFTFQEILSAIGMAQCVMILVYMLFRAGDLTRAVVPIAYFLVLGLAFFLDFSTRFLGDATALWPVLQWLAWFSGPPLSVLLVIQVARLSETPRLRDCSILLVVPAALGAAAVLAVKDESCSFSTLLSPCGEFPTWLVLSGLGAGGVSLLALWTIRGLLDGVPAQKNGRERYWLVLSLVIVNVLFLATMLASLSNFGTAADFVTVRTILGMGLAYLAGTSLFRIYPTAIRLVTGPQDLGPEEAELARKIEKLINLDKIYHEPAYSRADLARELNAPEATVSRVINVHFQKTFPQLLNERRVDDAKRLLAQTDAPVRTVAEEVGFNSLATFNRVFKEMSGASPGTYRQDVQGLRKPASPKAS